MTKEDLELEIDDLTKKLNRRDRTLSNVRIKLKDTLIQLEIRQDRVNELERLTRSLDIKSKSLRKRYEEMRNSSKKLGYEVLDLKSKLEKKEEQAAKLRHIVELHRASSAEPNYDVLRQPRGFGA